MSSHPRAAGLLKTLNDVESQAFRVIVRRLTRTRAWNPRLSEEAMLISIALSEKGLLAEQKDED